MWLTQAVEGDQRRGKHVMVFCNTLASCRATEHHLAERGVPTLCYHGDVPLDGRREALAQFASAADPPSSQPVLVCTDLAARQGPLPLRLVLRFDVIILSTFRGPAHSSLISLSPSLLPLSFFPFSSLPVCVVGGGANH